MTATGVLERAGTCPDPEDRPARTRDDARGVRGAGIAALGAALCAVAILPLMLAPIPPLVDLPGHLARIDILTRIGRSSFVANHWSADQWLVANLLFDAVT